MSHEDTLELAKLCGVNTLHFDLEIQREEEKYDNTLKEFYVQRLPFIVLQESKNLNENIDSTLKSLFNTISTIKVYQCSKIYVKYPFGSPVETRCYFDNLTFYVVGKWVRQKSKIHEYLRMKLGLKTDENVVRDIIDIEQPSSENDQQEWLSYQKEDAQKFYFVRDHLEKLMMNEKENKIDTLNPFESVKTAQSHPLGNEEKETGEKDLTSVESASSQTLGHLNELCLQKQPDEGTGFDNISTPTSCTITSCETLNPIESAKDVLSDSLENQEKDLSSDESASSQTLEGHLNELCSQNQQYEGTGFENTSTPTSSTITNSETLNPIESAKDVLSDSLEYQERDLTSYESASSQTLDSHLNELCLQKQTPIIDVGTGSGNIFTPSLSATISSNANISIGHFGRARMGPGHRGARKGPKKLDLNRLSGYTFRYSSAKGTRAQNALKSALTSSELMNPFERAKIAEFHLLKKKGTYSKLKKYKKEHTSDESDSSQSLEGHPKKLCLKKQHPIEDEGAKIDNILTPSSSMIRKQATRDSIEIEVETKCLIPNESETGPEIRIQPTTICSAMGSSTYFPEVSSEQSRMKWLCEKYVFTFLQDHYKDKYPNSQSNLLDGKFTLCCQSRNIEIVWLNASGEKKQPYDLLLKKEGVVSRLIDVQPTNFILNDSFYISHREFIRKINKLAAEFPEHKEKYCIYRIFRTGNFLSSTKKLNDNAALYKTVLLKSINF
ncbi:DUF3883 domain-containing protein [Trichonephila clavipes]|nr:DUF3883 domain-containing protein [Trichonephila clavipes]